MLANVPRSSTCRAAAAAGTDAGGAIGRDALDAGAEAAGNGIKPGETLDMCRAAVAGPMPVGALGRQALDTTSMAFTLARRNGVRLLTSNRRRGRKSVGGC
jgi:hypothetical protein